MLTDRPNIVVAVRTKKPKPAHNPPPAIPRNAVIAPRAAGLTEAEHDARGDAAQALWLKVSGQE